MCTFTTLSHNQNGYIVQCRRCNSFQLAFGTTLLHLKKNLFNGFCEYIHALSENTHCTHTEDARCIHADISCGHCRMILSANELQQLQQLTEQALFHLEMEELLEQNQIHCE